jgi:ABC-type lipoprotein export system ATPase subunit
MQNYFEIENLHCAYPNENGECKVVLEIEKLEIPRGKVVFIVGTSGCGKSTILETLGLMNNTIHHSLQNTSGAKFNFLHNEQPISLLDIDWEKDTELLSHIRRDSFSFIFQQTNLMENFSIRENAELSKMIKGGSGGKNYETIMQQVFQEEFNQIAEKPPKNLSGGQRQRLAFVRAFLPQYTILFGDEPTGNLDPEKARLLTDMICDAIHEDSNKTAIIVSHSTELAQKADIIIKINYDNHKKCGIICENAVFRKENNVWKHGNTDLSVEQLITKLEGGKQ